MIVPFSLPLMMNIKMAFFSVEKYKLQLSIVFLFLVAKKYNVLIVTLDITSTITNAAVR